MNSIVLICNHLIHKTALSTAPYHVHLIPLSDKGQVCTVCMHWVQVRLKYNAYFPGHTGITLLSFTF